MVEFYQSLIRIRKENKLLRSANPENFQFIKANGSDVAIGFMITHGGESIAVLINSHQNDIAVFDMNVDNWTPIISTQVGIELKNSKAKLPPISGIILKK